MKKSKLVLLFSVCALSVLVSVVRADDDALWRAICTVESAGDAAAIGDFGSAVGIAQIWKIMVDDCNRIIGHTRWTYADRLSPAKSREMFDAYLGHYARGRTDEQKARAWNGGPRGHEKAATLPYWRKVEAVLQQTVRRPVLPTMASSVPEPPQRSKAPVNATQRNVQRNVQRLERPAGSPFWSGAVCGAALALLVFITGSLFGRLM